MLDRRRCCPVRLFFCLPRTVFAAINGEKETGVNISTRK